MARYPGMESNLPSSPGYLPGGNEVFTTNPTQPSPHESLNLGLPTDPWPRPTETYLPCSHGPRWVGWDRKQNPQPTHAPRVNLLPLLPSSLPAAIVESPPLPPPFWNPHPYLLPPSRHHRLNHLRQRRAAEAEVAAAATSAATHVPGYPPHPNNIQCLLADSPAEEAAASTGTAAHGPPHPPPLCKTSFLAGSRLRVQPSGGGGVNDPRARLPPHRTRALTGSRNPAALRRSPSDAFAS